MQFTTEKNNQAYDHSFGYDAHQTLTAVMPSSALLTLSLVAAITGVTSLTVPSPIPVIALNNDSTSVPWTPLNNNTSVITGDSPLLGSNYQCGESGFFQKIKQTECNVAAIKLPDGHTPGMFHQGHPSDTYRLPQGTSEGSCIINIDLIGEERCQGTWTGIKLAIRELIAVCSEGSATSTHPGWITTGNNSKIKIQITRGKNTVGGEEETSENQGEENEGIQPAEGGYALPTGSIVGVA